jgi:hypothetical protein
MKSTKHRETSKIIPELSEVDSYLDYIFQPVSPRSQFVNQLEKRLVATPPPRIYFSNVLQYTILGVVGFFSSLIILVTGIRATMTFIGTLSVLRQIRTEIQHKRETQINSSV